MISEHDPPPRVVLEWVANQVHERARVITVVPLQGGISAAMDRITVAAPTGPNDVVLRRWPDRDRAQDLMAREACALAAIRTQGVPAPELLAADEHGEQTGVLCTLTSALTGEPDLAPADLNSWLGQLAATQAAIHAVPEAQIRRLAELDRSAPALAPDRYGIRDRPLDWITDSGLREAAREAAAGPLADEKILVHGDYQHFNVLWRSGRLTGVVDWPHAATGNRGTDVGHCRLNLAVLFDSATANDYLVGYERETGVRADRRADLRALLCFDLDWQRFIPRQMAGRAPLEVAGMPDRVTSAVRSALDGIE